jgi:hypothetical protein
MQVRYKLQIMVVEWMSTSTANMAQPLCSLKPWRKRGEMADWTLEDNRTLERAVEVACTFPDETGLTIGQLAKGITLKEGLLAELAELRTDTARVDKLERWVRNVYEIVEICKCIGGGIQIDDAHGEHYCSHDKTLREAIDKLEEGG